MMQAIFKNKLVIGIAVVLIVLFVGYFAIKGSGGSNSSSGVTKTAVSTSGSSSGSGAGAPGQEFVTQLLAIQNITLNLELFNDPVFLSLHDWSHELVGQPISRPNPFAPIDLTAISVDSGNTGVDATATTTDATPPKSFTPTKPATKSTKKTSSASTASTGSTGGDSSLFRAVP